MNIRRVVHVIDDDPSVLNSTAAFLLTRGFDVVTYGSAFEFLGTADAGIVGCIVTDVRMNGMSGIELATKLRERRIFIPVIIITAYADVSLVIEAMKHGAVDLLEKPFNNNDLVKSIREAVASWNEVGICTNLDADREKFCKLTMREKEVLFKLLKGSPNKIIAHELGVSTRTVETHRATIMFKMNASSLAELVRLSLSAS
jgi:two-component system, LuxR family, response regulator FixJ